MPITRNLARQYPLAAIAELRAVRDMGAGNEVRIAVPAGALVYSVVTLTETAFTVNTTSTVTVSDGTLVYVNAQDTKTAGVETVAAQTKFYPTAGVITCSMAETGTPAPLGRVFVIVKYVIVDRQNENQA